MLTIRVEQGDWGGAQLSDIEAVARSASESFDAFDDEALEITLQPTPSEEDPPRTTLSSGRLVVLLNVRGNLWARLAYQFAHEFCHVIADRYTWPGDEDRFAWVEEALCEAGSLFALDSMARRWFANPPYESWRNYSSSLAEYRASRVSAVAHSLPEGVRFIDWLTERLPLLEAYPGRRDDNTIIARELLHVFETPASWRALRSLHVRPSYPERSLIDFMNGWAESCSIKDRPIVEAIAARIT